MSHKALAFQEPYATLITLGLKTVECRSKRIKEPIKDLVVCASKTARIFYPIPTLVYGYAIGLVDVVDCVPFTKEHLPAAMMSQMPDKDSYAWILENSRMIKPFEVKASVGFFNVGNTPEVIPCDKESYRKHFLPIAHTQDKPYLLVDEEELDEAFDEQEALLELWFDVPEYIMEEFGL